MEAANDRKLLVPHYRRRIWLSRSTFCAGDDIFGFPVLSQSVQCILPKKFIYPAPGFVIVMLYPTHARTQNVKRLSFIPLVQDLVAEAQALVPFAAWFCMFFNRPWHPGRAILVLCTIISYGYHPEADDPWQIFQHWFIFHHLASLSMAKHFLIGGHNGLQENCHTKKVDRRIYRDLHHILFDRFHAIDRYTGMST